jgi:hypothetical protein
MMRGSSEGTGGVFDWLWEKRQTLLALFLLLLVGVLSLLVFERLPIEGSGLALDWQSIWGGVRGARPSYETGLRIPPWGAILLLPFGLLSLRSSWALITLATISALVACVPRDFGRWQRLSATILLATSYSALRLYADGNLEVLIIVGILLMIRGVPRRNTWALAGAVLLMTLKIQETWLLLIVLAIYVTRQWPRRLWLGASGIVAAVCVPSLLWLGSAWWGAFAGIQQRGSIMDASILAGLARLGLPGWAAGVVWLALLGAIILLARMSPSIVEREWAGLLVTASLILAPYAAGNSLVTVLAIGVTPMLAAWPLAGALVFLLDDLKYALSGDFMFQWGALYATAQFLLIGAILYVRRWRASSVNSGRGTHRMSGDPATDQPAA